MAQTTRPSAWWRGTILRVAANHWRALPADAEDQRWLERAVAVGATQRLDQPGSTRAEAFATGRTVYEPDIRVSRGPDHRAARAGLLSVASVPLLREGAPVGVLNVRSFRAHAYSEQHLRLLETFADQAVIAVENARLFRELQERLEQQTASAEILRAISESPTDLQRVLDAIAASAARLCEATDAAIFRVEEGLLRAVARHGPRQRRQQVGVERPIERPLRNPNALPFAVLRERQTIHLADVFATPAWADAGWTASGPVVDAGIRSRLGTPLLREGNAIGVLVVDRIEQRPFTDQQIALLETFADQAVIAIENARLFAELQESNHTLTEALEQQTATAEVLEAISRAPADLQAVLETLVANAVRLCRADTGLLLRREADGYRVAAEQGMGRPLIDYLAERGMAPGRDTASGRALLERRVVRLADNAAEPGYDPAVLEVSANRSLLAVPLLRDGEPAGVITVGRERVEPFDDRLVGLVQTFADQAVIAIENTRLFQELQESNRTLTEALEQQTATAEVLAAISRAPTDLQQVLDTIADSAARLCGTERAVIVLVEGDAYRSVAGRGGGDRWATLSGKEAPSVPLARARDGVPGRAIADGVVVHVPDLAAVPVEELPAGPARATGTRTLLAVPLLRRGEAIGAIRLQRPPGEVRPFTDRQIALVETFADQAVIAIENARLFSELQASNRTLAEALEQQTATAEVLAAISRAPTDLQQVLDTIADSAARLCGTDRALIFRVEGDTFRSVAGLGSDGRRSTLESGGRTNPLAEARDHPSGRAIADGAVVHLPDLAAVPEAELAAVQPRALGLRTMLAVPMLRQGVAIGAITLNRREVRPFTGQQIRLLETFADQAVIAMENARLFQELRARVEELQALGEVTRAVSSTLELETVLARIVDHARRLSGADRAVIFEYDEAADEFRLRSAEQLDDAPVVALRAAPLRLGQGAVGRAAATRAPVQIPDILAEGAYQGHLLDGLVQAGYRALLAVPLLREDRVLGGLVVSRRTPGTFPDEVVALLQTFASQSALAIQNARLFRELEDKGRQLEVASRHKSEFLANMSHELRTPLNAILGYTELIADGIYGEVPETIGGVLERVQASGRHLLGLINAVLDLAKIEAGQLTLTLEAYSPREVVQAVVSATESLAAAKGLVLRVEAPGDLPAGRGDEQRLSQVLLNLVGNAIKFTPSGEVRVRASVGGGDLLVSVSDTGPGIEPAQQARVFEEFQQADGSGTRGKGGTGLGLAIARRIVELHGGRIWVESAPGQGSTFSFTVPLRVESQAAPQAVPA